MSKTTYSKIERGETDLKYHVLLAICNSFGMSINELLLYSSENDLHLFIEIINDARNDSNNEQKKAVVLSEKYYSSSKIELMNFNELNYYCAIKCLFANVWSEVISFTSEEILYIHNFLFEKNFYVQSDYQILMNTILFMSNSQINLIFSKMYPLDTNKRRTYLYFNFALRAVLNVISLHIYRLEYKEADEVILFAEKNLDFSKNYSLGLSFDYHKNLVKRFLLRDTLYIEKARDVINIMKTVGKKSIALTFEEELNNLTDRADYYLDDTVANYPRTPVE